MSTYLLVHGAWHGAWCWYKVTPLLEAAGHTVLAPDLPGHGDDHTPIAEITLGAYVDAIVETIDQAAEPVILVGHSMGGAVISMVAEQRPEQIIVSVYLAAFMLANRTSLLDGAQSDPGSQVLPNLLPNEAEGYADFKPEALKSTFYADCSDEDVAYATQRLCSQAQAPMIAPMKLSDHNYGRVPRVLIECLQDRAISIEQQRAFAQKAGVDKTFTLDTSHSPFFSAPAELADCLLSLA